MNYDMSKILPHDYPMILIDNVIEYDLNEKSVKTFFTVNNDNLFFDKSLNGIPASVGIEFMAQSIGCFAYFSNGMQPPQIGYLLGTRLFKSNINFFKLGNKYEISAKELYNDNQLVSFECFVYNNEGSICQESKINAYIPD